MSYTREKPRLALPPDARGEEIIGWGVDLSPSNRPSVPKEKFSPEGTGAHWDFPERQIPTYRRERTPEHKFLTPVFGTVCPPRGLSGVVRRYAYTFSEGRVAHWLLLMFADRVDILESNLRDLLRGRWPNPIKEYGLKAEIKGRGLESRMGNRYDTKHYPLDLLYFAGTSVAVIATFFAARRVVRLLRS